MKAVLAICITLFALSLAAGLVAMPHMADQVAVMGNSHAPLAEVSLTGDVGLGARHHDAGDSGPGPGGSG